jgi:hypothetical protein
VWLIRLRPLLLTTACNVKRALLCDYKYNQQLRAAMLLKGKEDEDEMTRGWCDGVMAGVMTTPTTEHARNGRRQFGSGPCSAGLTPNLRFVLLNLMPREQCVCVCVCVLCRVALSNHALAALGDEILSSIYYIIGLSAHSQVGLVVDARNIGFTTTCCHTTPIRACSLCSTAHILRDGAYKLH